MREGSKMRNAEKNRLFFPTVFSNEGERTPSSSCVGVLTGECMEARAPRWYYSKNISRDSIADEEMTGNETEIEKKNQALVDLGECAIEMRTHGGGGPAHTSSHFWTPQSNECLFLLYLLIFLSFCETHTSPTHTQSLQCSENRLAKETTALCM